MAGAFLTILLIDHLSSPVKGIINTTTAIPTGMSQNCLRLFNLPGGLTFTIHQELSIFSTRCMKACIIPQSYMGLRSETKVE